MNVPKEIRYQVISLYIEGKSVGEMISMVGLSEDQVQNILLDLNSPESQKILSYLIAIKYGKDGQDVKHFSELLEAIKVLVQQGVPLHHAIALIVDMSEFSQATGLAANEFVPAFSIYNKFAASMGIRNYQDFSKKKLQIVLSLEAVRGDEKVLEERYRSLSESTVCKDEIDFGVESLVD